MTEATLDGHHARSVLLERLSDLDAEASWEFQASIALPGAKATVRVYEYGTGLRDFFEELAQAWQGFDGVMSYYSCEGRFAVDARHDGLGTVECVVRLGALEPPEWKLEAALQFGAGAHLDRIARDVAAFVP